MIRDVPGEGIPSRSTYSEFAVAPGYVCFALRNDKRAERCRRRQRERKRERERERERREVEGAGRPHSLYPKDEEVGGRGSSALAPEKDG